MANELIELPQYTFADYMDSSKPFEWLADLPDRFTQERMVQKMQAQAKAAGVKSFMKLWESYKKSMSNQNDTEISNLIEVDGMPDECKEFTAGKYICDSNGVQVPDSFGILQTICPHPIMPVRRYINVDSGEEYLELWWSKTVGDESSRRSRVVSKDDIANNISKLAKYGVVVSPGTAKQLSAYILNVEQYNYASMEEQQSVTRLGWIGQDEFSPYVEQVRFDGEEDFGSIFSAVKSAGNYNAWKDAIRKVRKEDTAARVYLAASFASVILKPCGLLPFMVHLWGTSEIGKSVALMIAASVWADPEIGEYITTYNGTRYAQETKAAFLNNLPLCLDELQIQSSQGKTDFDDTIYQLCEGVSKAQGKASGGLRKQLRWKNVILSNGEHPIVKGLSGGGAANRVIEIETDKPVYSDLIGLCEIIKANYGHAGKEFVEWLKNSQNMETMRELQSNYYASLRDGNATDKQVAAASAILTADYIATDLIFQDGMCLTVEDMDGILLSKSDMDVNNRTYEWLLDYIVSNQMHFDPDNAGKTEIWGEWDGNELYFIRSVFNRELKRNGMDAKSFLSWASKNGKIRWSKGHYDTTKRIGSNKAVTRCVCLNLGEMGEELPY